MELNIKADLTQTLVLRQMHDLMEINIKSKNKFECIFIDKEQAKKVIEKLQLWVGQKVEPSNESAEVCIFCGSENLVIEGNLKRCTNCNKGWQT